jgi:hypothetical protein
MGRRDVLAMCKNLLPSVLSGLAKTGNYHRTYREESRGRKSKTSRILLKSSARLKPAKDQLNRLIWRGCKPEPSIRDDDRAG